MEKRMTIRRNILKYGGGSFSEQEALIVVEFPLTVKLNGEEFGTMVCTPEGLEDLVIGFLASEGIIRFVEEVDSLSVDVSKGFAYVELKNKQPAHMDTVSKRFIGSCCGKSRQFYFYNDMKTAKTVTSRLQISPEQIFALMDALQSDSTEFQSTGGLHNAALCTPDGIVHFASDIGRHNALDKIYGHMLKNRIPAHDKLVAFSGRISSEVLLKIAKIGCGILLSKSAPSDLALDLADDLGITAIGFIRNRQMNIYTHPHRVRV
ncbi:formate dehydrogenase accessory sulfurtransferase FdhD [Ferviditalea candida]|uniref:Sulfur carrier protein FdhD n=1 Tax=Ferviditalea candida TaxID=3108399 RepID=A0ABU5ZJL7_9BACL|nr:formate dehydrogenase accessory sulfurtransferase FdhD [Paenibacillaceae bacterium T2]